MAPRLELRNLQKSFDAVRAVRDLSMALERGEFVSLLGPSGCGKSTTLAMIAGFETPTAGDILVDGVVVTRLAPQRRRIGLVFQDYAVFSRMTVRGNLAFGLAARGVGRARRRPLVEGMAAKLGLTDILDRGGDRLNMSEMQRVALGRVLLTEPELVLLDEPMSNLDAALRATLRGELKQIQRELGQTVLYVTHDQLEAMSMSDRIAIMKDGEILQFATPDEIYDRPCNRFVAEFIGDPPINVVACDVAVSGAAVAASTALHAGLDLGRRAIAAGRHLLAFRPHDVEIAERPGPGSAAATVRFVETLGAESVFHVDHGGEMIRVVGPPDAAAADATVHLTLRRDRLLLIESGSDRVVPATAVAP
jgi:multiple sugar transport system ATP-binding protein